MASPEIGHPLVQRISLERYSLSQETAIPLGSLAVGNVPGPFRNLIRDPAIGHRASESVLTTLYRLTRPAVFSIDIEGEEDVPIGEKRPALPTKGEYSRALMSHWWGPDRLDYENLIWSDVFINPPGDVFGVASRNMDGVTYRQLGYFPRITALGKPEANKFDARLAELPKKVADAILRSEIQPDGKPYRSPRRALFAHDFSH